MDAGQNEKHESQHFRLRVYSQVPSSREILSSRTVQYIRRFEGRDYRNKVLYVKKIRVLVTFRKF